VLPQRERIDFARNAGQLQECPELGGEREPVVARRVVERLDAEVFARQDERVVALVPDGQREHAVEALEAFNAEAFVEKENGLGVAVRAELASLRFELAAQLREVV